MDKKIFEIAAAALDVDIETVKINVKHLPEIDAYYFWNPIRGGRSLIINSKYEKLVVGSAINFAGLLKSFTEGKRN